MVRKIRLKELTLAVVLLFVESGTLADESRPGKSAASLRVNSSRLEAGLEALAAFGKTPEGGVNRAAFSESDLRARLFIREMMIEAGLSVRLDEAGNIIGRLDGREAGLPALTAGSHLDSVPNGGRYDGALGVLAAVECCRTLRDNGIRLRHPLEVIVFADEEGGLVGSRAMLGEFDDRALDVVTQSGLTVREGIAAAGGNPANIKAARRGLNELAAYIELHIEQGNVLDSRKFRIGIVEGIVGLERWEVEITGTANHAGTTPMDNRQDALVAAAQCIVAVNRTVTALPGRQVGTVGRIKAEPGAVNVIPGKVIMSLELRDLSMKKISSIFAAIQKEASLIAQKTRTKIHFSQPDAAQNPAILDPGIIKLISLSAMELGLSSLKMPSGAGHDAQNMARLAPTGMIFVPSVGGISHSPQEFSRPEDLEAGANVLLITLVRLDGQSTHSTPRAEARGMRRVNTERRFLPRFKNRGLAPSNVSTVSEDLHFFSGTSHKPLSRS